MLRSFLGTGAATRPVPRGAGIRRTRTEPHLPVTWWQSRFERGEKNIRYFHIRSKIREGKFFLDAFRYVDRAPFRGGSPRTKERRSQDLWVKNRRRIHMSKAFVRKIRDTSLTPRLHLPCWARCGEDRFSFPSNHGGRGRQTSWR